MREAFIDGFRDQVHSRYDEGEERFPGSEHSRAQEKKRESFCQSFSAHVAQKVADLPAKEKILHRIAREWEEGVPEWARYTICEGYDPFEHNDVNLLKRMFKRGTDEKLLHRIVREANQLRAADPSRAHLVAMIQETTCDWCGRDIQTLDDHKIVDRQPMCNPCVNDAFGLQRATPPQQELGMER